MRQTKVKAGELLEILRKNRAEHRGIFLEAQKRYRETVITMLDEQLKLARDGKEFLLSSLNRLHAPQDYTREYDRAILMLEMGVDTEITLTADEFRTYVQDIWNWSQVWARSASNYVVGNAKLQSLQEEND